MSKSRINLRFDGPSLSEHKIDVAILAPALMAMGELFREANRIINDDRATVKVVVNADIKANCVTLSLDVIQEVWSAVKLMLTDENVATAKDLVEWLLLGSPVWKGLGLSTLGILRLKSEHKDALEAEPITVINDSSEDGCVKITIKGDNNTVLVAPAQAWQLAQSPTVVKALQNTVAPLVKDNGITEATFIAEEKESAVTQAEAKEIYNLPIPKSAEQEIEPQYVIGHIMVRSPTFDPKSNFWEFWYNNIAEKMDISETSIAQDTINRGEVVVGDTYRVKMEITERKSGRGYKNHYKVVEVFEFIPGSKQFGFNLEDSEESTFSKMIRPLTEE